MRNFVRQVAHRLRRRKEERDIRSLNRASRREWARNENAELAAAWHAFPVELRVVVVTRLFLAHDFGRLERHLAGIAESAGLFKATAQRDISEFFHRSRTAAGARGYWTRAADVQPPTAGGYQLGPSTWPSLPTWVDTATLYLGMARAGIASLSVMMGVRDDAEVLGKLFRSNHETLVRRSGRHEHSLLVADAKATALGRMLRDATDCGLFPRGAGEPSDAYPGAVGVLYDLRQHALPEDRAWRDIERVLGLDWLEKWDDGSVVVAGGLPHPSDELTGGVSIITLNRNPDEDVLRTYVRLNNYFKVRYMEFMLGLTPWMALRGTLDELTNASAVLRQRLQQYHPFRIRNLRHRGRPKSLLDDLSKLRHTLLQLRSFTEDPWEPSFQRSDERSLHTRHSPRRQRHRRNARRCSDFFIARSRAQHANRLSR